MNFKALVIGGIFTLLFAVGLIMIDIQITSENNLNNTLMSNPYVNSTYDSLNSNLNSSQGLGTNITTGIQKEGSDVVSSPLGFWLKSILSGGSQLITYGVGIFSMIIQMVSAIFELNPIIPTAFIAILTITIGLLFWRLLRAGE